MAANYERKLEHSRFLGRGPIVRVLVAALVVIPAVMFFWLLGVLKYRLAGETNSVPPGRWLFAIVFPAVLAYKGLRKDSLSVSGAVTGYFVGFVLTVTNRAFLASLLVFFTSSSWATKYRGEEKVALEEHYKKGGQRNWIQVLCNGGVATYLALAYFVQSGCGEQPIDLDQHYHESWLSIAVLGSLACCNGDTWASELGSVLSSSPPRLITTLQPVPKGTNGGVTLAGLVVSALGGLVVGVAFYLALLMSIDSDTLARAAPQWPLVPLGLVAGLGGSLVDSLLGAVCQFSGVKSRPLGEGSGRVVEVVVDSPGPGVRKISGSAWLDNHVVNLLSSLITACALPYLGRALF